MKASEVNQLTNEELMDKYRKLKEELFHLRFQLATGQLEKTHRLRGLRRDLARVLTFLNKQGGAALTAAPKAPKAPKAEKAPKAAKPAKAAKPEAPAKAAAIKPAKAAAAKKPKAKA